MMIFLRSYKCSPYTYISISRVLNPLLYSTKTNFTKPTQISKNEDSLYKRMSPVGDPKISMIPIVDQWEKEGKAVRFEELIVIIKSLRKFNRYTHAFQLSEWMAKRKKRLSSAGVAVHLDLMWRAQGLEEAEKYFNSIPDAVKNFQVYGALLYCYAAAKSVEKAEATAATMRQMGLMRTLSYNAMLDLYKKVGDYVKLDEVYQEMLEMGIPCNKPTYYIRLSAYASASDLEKMEKILKQMEENSTLGVDAQAYIIASGGYSKSGLTEKAFEMLNKSEEYVRGNSKGATWEILLRMYSALGKKEDVYRIWNLYKSSWSKVYNRGYSSIINALVKLDDMEGAEKILSEWESANLSFDFRIPNMVIKAYCTKGHFEKAEAHIGRITDVGKKPPASTWGFFVSGYTAKNEMEKAVEMLKKCMAATDKRGLKLDQDTIRKCLDYMKEKGTLEEAEDIERTFQDVFHLRPLVCKSPESLEDETSESQEYNEVDLEESHQ